MPSDPNKAAALTVKLVTERLEQPAADKTAISQYLASIGRKGGIKGGKARAEILTPEERTEIARNAAKARWQSEKKQ
jgi:ABC-type branched-subunit amino acid transport system substrate-binding protein